MGETQYHGRRAYSLDNGILEIIVTVEGGHIAAVTDKTTGVNPLWLPPWKSIEPSTYDPARHPGYGADAESKLLAGILGHNLCLDTFGGVSDTEAAAGMTVHGEASVVRYDVHVTGDGLSQKTTLPEANLQFTRTIRLPRGARTARIVEQVTNLSAWDRPAAWTQHATLGPPFLEKGKTLFRASATRSKVLECDAADGKGHMKIGAEFDWPLVPCIDGSAEDLRVFTNRKVSGAFSTHLMDPARQDAFFLAWSPTHGLAFGYRWKREDFPWLGIWEENYCRTRPPWNGVSLTRGMEFGASPFPEMRRAMIERGRMFDTPGYRWIPAHRTVTAEYEVFLVPTDKLPETPPKG